MLTSERLRHLFSYDPKTGVFTRNPIGRRYPKPVGHKTAMGYIRITINQHGYMAHRLAWLYVHGCWPSGYLDHADGDHANNSIANLREATPAENSANIKGRKRAFDLPRGVSYSKNHKKFRAKISFQGVYRYLGQFDDQEVAAAAYRNAAEQLHGKFAFHLSAGAALSRKEQTP